MFSIDMFIYLALYFSFSTEASQSYKQHTISSAPPRLATAVYKEQLHIPDSFLPFYLDFRPPGTVYYCVIYLHDPPPAHQSSKPITPRKTIITFVTDLDKYSTNTYKVQ